jgi:hypothetical protein
MAVNYVIERFLTSQDLIEIKKEFLEAIKVLPENEQKKCREIAKKASTKPHWSFWSGHKYYQEAKVEKIRLKKTFPNWNFRIVKVKNFREGKYEIVPWQ